MDSSYFLNFFYCFNYMFSVYVFRNYHELGYEFKVYKNSAKSAALHEYLVYPWTFSSVDFSDSKK